MANTEEFLNEALPEHIVLDKIVMKESLHPNDDNVGDIKAVEMPNGLAQQIQPEEDDNTKKTFINPLLFYLLACFAFIGIQAGIFIIYEKRKGDAHLKRVREAKEEKELEELKKDSNTMVVEYDEEAVGSLSTMTKSQNQVSTEQIWMNPTPSLT